MAAAFDFQHLGSASDQKQTVFRSGVRIEQALAERQSACGRPANVPGDFLRAGGVPVAVLRGEMNDAVQRWIFRQIPEQRFPGFPPLGLDPHECNVALLIF